jgi:hypothetical protein
MERYDLGWALSGAGPLTRGRVLEHRPPPFLSDELGVWVANDELMRELPIASTIIAGSGLPEAGIPHLTRLRPVFAARVGVEQTREFVPWLWVFKRVPGAEIEGRAEPGARVVASLAWTVHGNRLIWKAWADADETGRYRITVPLPTGTVGMGIETAPAYRLSAAGRSLGDVAVPEDAVTAGRTVPIRLVAAG